jgi:hypothetical protein
VTSSIFSSSGVVHCCCSHQRRELSTYQSLLSKSPPLQSLPLLSPPPQSPKNWRLRDWGERPNSRENHVGSGVSRGTCRSLRSRSIQQKRDRPTLVLEEVSSGLSPSRASLWRSTFLSLPQSTLSRPLPSLFVLPSSPGASFLFPLAVPVSSFAPWRKCS